jgi:hypothetical protein
LQGKRTTQFRKFFDLYCERRALAKDSVSFFFKGSGVHPEQTPEDLGMEGESLYLFFPSPWQETLSPTYRSTGGLAFVPDFWIRPAGSACNCVVSQTGFNALLVWLISIFVFMQMTILLM